MEYLNQPGGSVGEVTRLEAIAAQMNVPIDTVAYLNFGDAIGTARFLFDPILQRTWLIPFSVPRDTVMETMINDQLNGKYTLTPCDLLVTHFHYSWQKHMAQGVWIRTKTDLVWCLEDGVWYRWVGDESKFPFITTNITSPRKSNDVVSPANPLGNWEDMGITGLGATYKGDRGEQGKSNYDLWLEAGNKGTFEDYQKTLVGPRGPQGFQGQPGETGPQGKPGNQIETMVGNVTDLKDLPCPPTPPSYGDNPNALFVVSFTSDVKTLIPGIEKTATIKVTDANTGKPVDLKADTLRVNIANGLGSATIPVKVTGKTGEYTVKLGGTAGTNITFAVFISDIYMHNSDLRFGIIQFEDAYNFNIISLPNLMEVNGTGTSLTLQITNYLTGELEDIPESAVSFEIAAGKGVLSEITKSGVGTYTAKLKDRGETGAIYVVATVNGVRMNSSTLVVNVVTEFNGKFWEVEAYSAANGNIPVSPYAFGSEVSGTGEKNVVYINGQLAKYVGKSGTSHDTMFLYTAPNVVLDTPNTLLVTGSSLFYWTNYYEKVTQLGNGVDTIDCGFWGNTTKGTTPSIDCPLPKAVTNLNYSFYACRLPEIKGIEKWDVSHVTSFVGTFAGSGDSFAPAPRRTADRFPTAYNYTTPLPWNMAAATNINYMFCLSRSNDVLVDITNMPNLLTAIGLFRRATSLSWEAKLNWPKCTSISRIFSQIEGAISVNLDGSALPKLNDMGSLLVADNPIRVNNVNLSMRNIDFKDLQTVAQMVWNRAFDVIDFSGCNFGEVTNTGTMFYIVPSANLKPTSFNIRLVNAKFPKVTNAVDMFRDYASILVNDVAGMEFPVLADASRMFMNCETINFTDLSKIITGNLRKSTSMFENCYEFNADINKCDVSGIVDASKMFSKCLAFNKPLIGLKFTNLTNAELMFNFCTSFNQDIAPLFASGTVTKATEMFQSCTSFNYTLENCDFSKLVNATSMFDSCSSFNQPLENVAFPVLNVATSMFRLCTGFNQSVVKLNMPNLTVARSMFAECTALNTPLTGMTLPRLVDGYALFQATPSLNKNCQNMYFPELVSMDNMFQVVLGGNGQLPRTIDLTGSRFPKVIKATYLFAAASPLDLNMTNVSFDSLIDGSNMFNSVNLPRATLRMKGAKFPNMTTGVAMFQGMSAMNDDFADVDFSSLADATNMFKGCAAFNPSFKNTKFGAVSVATGMFADCSALNSDIVLKFVSTVTNADNMFKGCIAFNQSISGMWANLTSAVYMFQDCVAFNRGLEDATFQRLASANNMFFGCKSFNQSIPASAFPMLVNATGMFNGCVSFDNTVGLNFDTITITKDMFKGCLAFNQPLTYNLSGVLDASSMFNGCVKLNQPIAGLKLPVALDITMMFSGCVVLNQPVTGFSAPKALNASGLFRYCTAMNQELTGINLPNATDLSYMFSGCTSQSKGIDLVFDGADDMTYMFSACTGLGTAAVKVKSARCTNASNMFNGCYGLNAAVTLTMPNLTNIGSTFYNCTSLDSPVSILSDNLTNAESAFANCSVFNQSLEALKVDKVRMFTAMFLGAAKYNQPMKTWVTTSAQSSSNSNSSTSSMARMFSGAFAFEQDISMWRVPQITEKPYQFDSGTKATWTTAMKPQWGK